jgi:hypothetical protein
MSEADCVVVFMISCEEKTKRYMLSHTHPEGFNIEPCWACVEKCISYTETGAENVCKTRTQLFPQADLSRILNGFTHIKRGLSNT